MRCSRWKLTILALGVMMLPIIMLVRARGSDHADTPAIAATPGADLTDVFIFPSAENVNNVVLAMNVHPLIPSGQGLSTAFDPNVLYQFKIDNGGDSVEDLVIQARFTGTDPATQKVEFAGPVRPSRTGVVTQFETPDSVTGTLNKVFTLSNGTKVFCGAREDPFFFDLEQFFKILPDRATPINPSALPAGQDPDAPQALTFRPVGQAKDFLAGLNVLSIIVELPKTTVIGNGDHKIRVWCTTSR